MDLLILIRTNKFYCKLLSLRGESKIWKSEVPFCTYVARGASDPTYLPTRSPKQFLLVKKAIPCQLKLVDYKLAVSQELLSDQ